MELISKLYKGKVDVKFLGPTPETPNRHMYYVKKGSQDWKRKTGVTTIDGILDKSRQLIGWAVDLAIGFIKANKKLLMQNGEEWDRILYEASIQHTLHLAKASNIGDQVHKWIEAYIKGEDVEMPESKEAQLGVSAFLDWERENDVKFISSERVVYSLKHDYIGKMDIEAKVNGKLCLIDIKTSNGIYNSFFLQTAAYVRADEEESNRKYKGRWIIRVAKETESEYYERMEEKNRLKASKGDKTFEPVPYQVFEAKFLDDEGTEMDRDFKGFLHAKGLFEWNRETDTFFKIKKD